ncbi:MAG: DUF2345 domain-containing protein [Flavobacteriaceae bacterium]|nr:DUF2345 domain-containing protein [Flavobacteriaceae bacterium]
MNAVKNMNLIAGENLHIQAGKDIHIRAGGSMQEQIGKHKNTTASGNIQVRATGDIQEQSDNRMKLAEEAYTRQAMDSHEAADEIIIQSQQDDLRLQSGKKVQVNGREGTHLF